MNYIIANDILMTSENGNARVVVRYEEGAPEPETDGAMPTLRIESTSYGYRSAELIRGQYGLSMQWHSAAERGGNRGAYSGREGDVFEDAFNRLYQSCDDHEKAFERYLRIFHGMSTIHWWGQTRSGAPDYVTFDTAAWRSKMMLDEAPMPADAAREDFAEYAAWCDGETYYLELQHRAVTLTEDVVTGDVDEDDDSWIEYVDTIGTVYGDDEDRAKAMARDYFDEAWPA